MKFNYDIIVIGGGHAGCEAAAAAANMGSKVLLITIDMTKFAQMSCNPAMGGIAKGQIIREIDALGGLSGIVTDRSTIQFRMLNRSKGAAMWSPRAQCDRTKFSLYWREELEKISNLEFCQDIVTAIIVRNNEVLGCKTKLGLSIYAKCIILTAGTFLNGIIYVGRNSLKGGRASDLSSTGLTEQLVSLGIETGRMKTGTPPRVDGRTIDFSKMIEQKGEEDGNKFSYIKDIKTHLSQKSCFITYTNSEVHNILRTGFNDSPLFDGTIKGIGPRYCPSIETKLVTFEDKDKHQIFIEPEGENTIEYYINGVSTSLPLNVQYEAIRKVVGLENVAFFRPGYAIEYDYFPPTQLNHTLESKIIKNLYFAGQVNGTTGYEEAACQGLIAGINAHLNINRMGDFIIKRYEGYIGVLIDDLVTKGVDEPYRMFTSRAEYRLLLRQDNADHRLTEKGYNFGLVKIDRFNYFKYKYSKINEIIDYCKKTSIDPETANVFLSINKSSEINQKVKIISLLQRPEIDVLNFLKNIYCLEKFDLSDFEMHEILESVSIEIKYQGHITREKALVEKSKRLEYIELVSNFDYSNISSLSTEAKHKLNRIKPANIGQASRIPGVSPADINVLLIHLGR